MTDDEFDVRIGSQPAPSNRGKAKTPYGYMRLVLDVRAMRLFDHPVLNPPYECRMRHWELDGQG